MLTADDCRQLETWIDETEEKNSPLKHFILPGGCELASRLHLARTCCRRAERYLVALDRASSLRPEVLVFMNRISDLLFALARQANHQASVEEEQAGGTA
jgi:cob(I)alamin adenosyltransferase